MFKFQSKAGDAHGLVSLWTKTDPVRFLDLITFFPAQFLSCIPVLRS